ncbi:cytochrome P450 [Pseudovirgaria hyperparasitica]|uniref:Cytochrome P450 n=1 Tax=Pseudovirgaria hyperparasitica TaxID=470096 RepID=A0A6A6W7P3_9PEZI|nr:cytochrome P450 [Pseudovirgaria hyperparasitica]KAF2758044.1 cytochrome P450 [Pseudovirgaria hyperparasitica]
MANLMLVSLVSAIIIILFKISSKLFPKPSFGLPHNPASVKRFLGDAVDIAAHASKTQEQSEALFLVNERINSPIAQLLIPSFRNITVLVDDPREAEDILKRRHQEFDRSATTATFFEYLLPKCSIAQSTTPFLKLQKRIWADTMSTSFLRRVVASNVHTTVLHLMEVWRLKIEQNGEAPFETKKDFNDAAMDMMWAAVLGSDLGMLRDQLAAFENHRSFAVDAAECTGGNITPRAAQSSREMFLDTMQFIDETVAAFTGSGMASLQLKYIKFGSRYRRIKKFMRDELQRLVSASRDRHMQISKSCSDNYDEYETCAMDLVLRRELMITAKQDSQDVYTTEGSTALLEELMLFLMAGIDSTGNTLAWCVKFLSLYQSAQNELRKALQSSFSKPRSKISATDIIDTDIPYLDAFLQETLRFAVTAGAIVRRTTVDTQILGYHVPAGTDVIMNTRVLKTPRNIPEDLRSPTSRAAYEKNSRSSSINGHAEKSLEIFEPSRWLSRATTGQETFNPHALPTLVFGGGFRGCFGKRLAMYELRIFVALLVLNFEFLPLDDEFRNLCGQEAVFRHPKQAFVKLRSL